MSALTELAEGLVAGSIEVIDLTSTLSSNTPLLELPPEFGQTAQFQLEEISRFDDRGPGWYWNNFRTGEHTGTHFDAPCHWNSNKDGLDISEVPVQKMIGPAVVLDFSAQVEKNHDFLVEIEDVQKWIAENGEIEEGSWLLVRSGWDARTDTQERATNANETGPHSPGMSPDCAEWVAANLPIIGMGVETIGTDAGQAFAFDRPFPCHSQMAAANKWGLAQLRNLDKLPVRGAVVVALPLPIVNGSGSPARVVALVQR